MLCTKDIDAGCKCKETLFLRFPRAAKSQVTVLYSDADYGNQEQENPSLLHYTFAPAPPEHRRRKRRNTLLMLR